MEEDESKDKKRILPQWMMEKVNRPSQRGMKRKKEISVPKRTVYCMNEKELVAYAMEIINKNKLHVVNKEESARIDNDGDVEPQDSPTAITRSSKMPPSPDNHLETTTTKSGTLSEGDDDPLKFVREIFFS